MLITRRSDFVEFAGGLDLRPLGVARIDQEFPVRDGRGLRWSDRLDRRFTLYGDPETYDEWAEADTRPPPEFEAGRGPDLRPMVGYWAECRWDQFFCAMVRILDTDPEFPLLVHDRAGVVWETGRLDPDRIAF